MVTRVLLSLLPLWIICLGMMLLPGLLLTGCMSSWLLLMFLIRRIRSFWLRLILGLFMGFLSGFLRLLIVVCGSILILILWMLFGLFISLLRGILRGLDLLLFKSILLFGGGPRRTGRPPKGDPGVSLVSGLVGPWFPFRMACRR